MEYLNMVNKYIGDIVWSTDNGLKEWLLHFGGPRRQAQRSSKGSLVTYCLHIMFSMRVGLARVVYDRRDLSGVSRHCIENISDRMHIFVNCLIQMASGLPKGRQPRFQPLVCPSLPVNVPKALCEGWLCWRVA